MIQQTSLDVFEEIKNDSKGLGQRQLIVYSGLLYLKSASNAMIAKHLRLPINCVVPRIFELRQMDMVEEDKRDYCTVTMRKVIFWRPKPVKPRQINQTQIKPSQDKTNQLNPMEAST